MEDYWNDDGLVKRVTSTCDHELDLCDECVAVSITTQFASKIWNHIDCPSCGDRLQIEDVNKHATKEIAAR